MDLKVSRVEERPTQPQRSQQALDVLLDILAELRVLNGAFDDFARTHLNARFPHGKPMDRWGRRG